MDTQIVFTPENEGSKRIIRMKTILLKNNIALCKGNHQTEGMRCPKVLMASKRKRYT